MERKDFRMSSAAWGRLLGSGTCPLSSFELYFYTYGRCKRTRHGYDSFLFDSIQISLRKFWFDSWLTMASQELIQINSRIKTDFGTLIQIDSRLKKLPEYFDWNQSRPKNFPEFWFKSIHDSQNIWNIDSTQVMTQWFESTVDFAELFGLSFNSLTIFGLSLNIFLGLSSWLNQYLEDLNPFNSWLKRLSRN